MKRIAQVTDLHLDDEKSESYGINTRKNIQKVLADVHSKKIEYVVFTGDLGEEDTIMWLNSLVKTHQIKADFIFGNHDNPAHYKENSAFSEDFHGDCRYYCKEDEGFLQLFLDSGKRVIEGEQLSWLKVKCLSSKLPILIFIHHPILDCDDSMMDKEYPLLERDGIRDFLFSLSLPVTVVCGHYHTTHEQTVKNIHQLVTLSTYIQMKPHSEKLETGSKEIGYRILNLNCGQVTSQIIDVT